jgi:uncharacterized protein YdeI (YjbR/CyaY-like superfamily)
MLDAETRLVNCFRQLTPENQSTLLACFQSALAAENSVKKIFSREKAFLAGKGEGTLFGNFSGKQKDKSI